MKNLFILSIIFIFVFPTLLLAEGPSVDSGGDPTTPSVKIKISNSQRNDINTKRIIKLTKSQMKSIAPSWETISLGIISEEWKDCSCGMLYAFWTDPNEISIPDEMIEIEKENYNDYDLISFLKNSIIMDSSGLFYREGKKLNLNTLKKESMGSHQGIMITVPSAKILNRDKRNKYLKKLINLGIVYEIFG